MHDLHQESVPNTNTDKPTSTYKQPEQADYIFQPQAFLTWGILISLLLATLIRFYGSFIFRPNEPLFALGLYLISSLVILFLVFCIYRWQHVAEHMQSQVSILLALPTIILGSVVMVSFRTSFPNLAPSSDSAVASWLLWCVAFILLAAFMKRDKT